MQQSMAPVVDKFANIQEVDITVKVAEVNRLLAEGWSLLHIQRVGQWQEVASRPGKWRVVDQVMFVLGRPENM